MVRRQDQSDRRKGLLNELEDGKTSTSDEIPFMALRIFFAGIEF